MEYKLIKKFLPELNIEQRDQLFSISSTTVATTPAEYIKASDLEAELAKGVEVFGIKFNSDDKDSVAFALYDDYDSTHSGLLIGYQPIESSEPVSREEILELLADLSSSMSCSTATKVRLETEIKLTNEIRKRILENGIK